jgi:hypothetical protein
MATAEHKRASSRSLDHKALISPLQLLAEHAQRHSDRISQNTNQLADRRVDHFHRLADRAVEVNEGRLDRESTERIARFAAARRASQSQSK